MSNLPEPKPDNVGAVADAIKGFHEGLPNALKTDFALVHLFAKSLLENSTIVVHYTVPQEGDR